MTQLKISETGEAACSDSPRIELLDTQGRITQAFPQPVNNCRPSEGHRPVTRMDAAFPVPETTNSLSVNSNPLSRKRKTSPSRPKIAHLSWASKSLEIKEDENESSKYMEIPSNKHKSKLKDIKAHGASFSSTEVIENSETESAKDSRGWYVDHLPADELENKFNNVALAFKTDRLTVKERLDSHRRQRDVAEKNIESEHATLKNFINEISHVTKDVETRDNVAKILNHLDIFMQSVSRLSSKAEVYGSVQQEERISNVLDVVMTHTTNLTREKDKAIMELLDMKRHMSEVKFQCGLSDAQREMELKKDNQSQKLASNRSPKARRASLAAISNFVLDAVGFGGSRFLSSRADLPSSVNDLRSRCSSAISSQSLKINNTPSSAKSSPGNTQNTKNIRRISLPASKSLDFNKNRLGSMSRYRHYQRPHLTLKKIDSVDSSCEENNNKNSMQDAYSLDEKGRSTEDEQNEQKDDKENGQKNDEENEQKDDEENEQKDEKSTTNPVSCDSYQTSVTDSISSSPLPQLAKTDEDVFFTQNNDTVKKSDDDDEVEEEKDEEEEDDDEEEEEETNESNCEEVPCYDCQQCYDQNDSGPDDLLNEEKTENTLLFGISFGRCLAMSASVKMDWKSADFVAIQSSIFSDNRVRLFGPTQDDHQGNSIP
ncbi:Protein MRVI1 [Nymphon striatum]|nr:Protein MRVI1 [Nymphon striatum]